jgi:hypothetical protein
MRAAIASTTRASATASRVARVTAALNRAPAFSASAAPLRKMSNAAPPQAVSAYATATPFHLAFPVHDLDAARAFYRDLLGCQCVLSRRRRVPSALVHFSRQPRALHYASAQRAHRILAIPPRPCSQGGPLVENVDRLQPWRRADRVPLCRRRLPREGLLQRRGRGHGARAAPRALPLRARLHGARRKAQGRGRQVPRRAAHPLPGRAGRAVDDVCASARPHDISAPPRDTRPLPHKPRYGPPLPVSNSSRTQVESAFSDKRPSPESLETPRQPRDPHPSPPHAPAATSSSRR